mgnify:CR=1 FL=1
MKASLDISMYPLDKDYTQPILDFIERMQSYQNLSVKTNSLSTHIFGEYDELMTAVSTEMKISFEKDQKIVTVLKIINADREHEGL